MKAILGWLQSVRGTVGPTTNRDETTAEPQSATNDEPESSLFHCSSCEAVYIASEKETCKSCNETVDQVQSTLE